MTDFRKRYLQALGTDNSALKETLDRAHEIRKFEIELYWKRATYFWAFQLIAFTLLGLLVKDGNLQYPQLLLVPSSIGVITGLAGYFTARGSKFWQENWESHIDLLEVEMKERLTQVIISRRHPQFSLSRTNEFLLSLLTIGWAMILIAGGIPKLAQLVAAHPLRCYWIGVVIVVLACVLMFWSKRTNLRGRSYSSQHLDWEEYPSNAKPTLPFIIWRDPLNERRLRTPKSTT
jgi:hypothetical protein